jgi:eukaryotic-like serine/threonine-protein kinase
MRAVAETGRTLAFRSCLGRGGFGEVYRATMTGVGGLTTDVAVKVLRSDLDPASQAVQRLKDEGRLLARLNHPAILNVYDLLVVQGRVALITEFVDGADLAEVMVGPTPPRLRALLEVLGAVAGALDEAWSAPLEDGSPLRLVHRDIKPSNIRISRHGDVKLLDFGIARTDSVSREAQTRTNMMVGSPPYMAPERFRDNDVRPASDVFALGVCLYEGLVGQRLHHEMSVPMLAGLAMDDDYFNEHVQARLAVLPESVPQTVRDMLGKLLAYVPEERPSAAEVVRTIAVMSDEVGGASLRRWTGACQWPVEEDTDGELVGSVLSDGTLVQIIEANDEGTALRRLPRAAVAGALVTMVVALILVCGLSGLGVEAVRSGWLGVPEEASVEAVESVAPGEDPAPKGLPEPVEQPGSAETTDAEAASESGQPVAEGKRPPRPEPVVSGVADAVPTAQPVVAAVSDPHPGGSPGIDQEEPVALTPPDPSSAAAVTGHVALSDETSVRVELVDGGSRFTLPADVPPGTYQITGFFPGSDKGVSTSVLQVEAGGSYTVKCLNRFRRCVPET